MRHRATLLRRRTIVKIERARGFDLLQKWLDEQTEREGQEENS